MENGEGTQGPKNTEHLIKRQLKNETKTGSQQQQCKLGVHDHTQPALGTVTIPGSECIYCYIV